MPKKAVVDMEAFASEVQYVFEAASLRDVALKTSEQLKTLAKAAKEIAGELDEHERLGVSATRSGKPGDLFENMTNQEAEQRQQAERIAALAFAADVAFVVARAEPSQLTGLRQRLLALLGKTRIGEYEASQKQAAG